MGQKQTKKIRQLFRREIRDTVQKMASESFETGDLFNIKPKWCPLWLWEKLQAMVVNKNFRHNYETIQRKIKEGKTNEILAGNIKQ